MCSHVTGLTAMLLVSVLSLAVAKAEESLPGGAAAGERVAGSTEIPKADPTEARSGSLLADEDYDLKFRIYTWIPNYHGAAGLMGNTSTLDVSCNDVFHALDEVTCMVPVNVEARLGRWGVIADLFYVRLKDSSTQGLVDVDVESTQTIMELAGFYRVCTWATGSAQESFLTVDVLGGARYNRLTGTIGLVAPGRSISVGGVREWCDPFVGARIAWQPTEKLSFFARGDVGGFGLHGSSDCAWQVTAAGSYGLTDHCFLELGYRVLATDYEEGSGSSRFVYDVTMHGPYLAVGLGF